jgi:glycerol kinase
LTGLTRGTTAAHIARATLEGIAFEVWDLLAAMQSDSKRTLRTLRVDGGAAANDLLMQFQADVAKVTVERPAELESTGRGAAMLAGVGVGLVPPAGAAQMLKVASRLAPKMGEDERAAHLARWKDAVGRAKTS